VVMLTSSIYPSSRQLQGQYQELSKAALSFFASLPAYDSEAFRFASQSDMEEISSSIDNVLADMEIFAEMRELTFDAAKDAGQDPFISSSLTYLSSVYSALHAALLVENSFVLVTQCLYLIDSYPEGDTAALDAAINMMDAHTGTFSDLADKVNSVLDLLADMDRDNILSAIRLLNELIAENEKILGLLEDFDGDPDISGEDIELLRDALILSITLDNSALETLVEGAKLFGNAEPFRLVTVETMSYSMDSDIVFRQMSFFSFARENLKEHARYVLDAARMTGDALGQVASGFAEAGLISAGYIRDVAVASIYAGYEKENFGEVNSARYFDSLKEAARQAGGKILEGDSGSNFISTLRDYIDRLDPVHSSNENLTMAGYGKLAVYQFAKVALLDHVSKVLVFMDKNSTSEEREKAVVSFIASQYVSGIVDKFPRFELDVFALQQVLDIRGRAEKRQEDLRRQQAQDREQEQNIDETIRRVSKKVDERAADIAGKIGPLNPQPPQNQPPAPQPPPPAAAPNPDFSIVGYWTGNAKIYSTTYFTWSETKIYYRFFEDGTVIGVGSNFQPFSVVKGWLEKNQAGAWKRDDRNTEVLVSMGMYTVNGNLITGEISHGRYGKTTFTGVINSDNSISQSISMTLSDGEGREGNEELTKIE